MKESTVSNNEESGGASRIARYVTAFRLAASFLTILPVGPKGPVPEGLMAEAFGLFPLVGFVLGAAIAVEDLALAIFFGAPLRSGLVIITLVAITGAVHLDALADTADALAAGTDRERALKILRDTGTGVFGSIALFFWLGMQWAALSTLRGYLRGTALFLAPGLGRWAMVAVTAGMDYLRPAGAGLFLDPHRGWANLRLASAIALLALIAVFSRHALAAAAGAAAIAFATRWFYRRWLGGVTGDLIGAAGALAELTAMLLMAARLS